MIHIIDETKRYNDAIENNKDFSGAMELKNRIKELKDELRELLSKESNKHRYQ